jgi:hypothetical protein
MFHFKGYRMEVTNVALAILTDSKEAVPMPELICIQNRLYEHMTGRKPIASDEWLNEELKREKNCPLLQASPLSESHKAGPSSRLKRKARKSST